MTNEPQTREPSETAHRRRTRLAGRAVGVVRPVLIDKVERDHQQSDSQFLRRRIVVAVTIVVGATLLGLSFSTEPGDPSFYPLTFGLAATWVVGSLVSGPLHLGHIVFGTRVRRPIVTPIVVGLLLAGVFVVGGLVTREIPVLAQFTNNVLGYAKAGSIWLVALVTLVNGVAEELFFRGALFAAIGRKNPVVISTLLYSLATVAGGNPVLVFAAAILGLVTGLQRRARRRGPRTDPHPRHLVDGDAARPAAHLHLTVISPAEAPLAYHVNVVDHP